MDESSSKRKPMSPTEAMIIARNFFNKYHHQSFSLPLDSIVYYILKHPKTPHFYQKLVQTCKYFYVKNPIRIYFGGNLEYQQQGWRASSNGRFDIPLSKIWITGKIHVYGSFREKNEQNFIFSFSPKIYRCDVKVCSFENMTLFFKDLLLIASNALDVTFKVGVHVKYNVDTVVSLENIIKALPNVQSFYYFFVNTNASKIISSKTAYELTKIPHFCNLSAFYLLRLPYIFDIENFFTYIKKNKQTKIGLRFEDNHISDELQIRLQEIVDEILSNKNVNYKTPWIRFPGVDETSYHALKDIFDRE